MFDPLEDRIRRHGLGRLAAPLTANVQDWVLLRSEPGRDEAIEPSVPKLGGCPDLPPSAEWPRWRGASLSFVAQINTREIPDFADGASLPRDTLLSFFYEPEQSTWGFDPADRGSWRIFATPSTSQLERRSFPADLTKHRKFSSCRLSAKKAVSLPDPMSAAITKIGLTEEEDEAYLALFEDLMPAEDTGFNHQLFGHPRLVQNDMELECQLASNGVYCGDADGGSTSPRAKMLEAGASEWRLLLQVDSDDNAGMMWGDSGRLYFWMRSAAMRSGAFEEAWMILQCY